MNIGLSIIIPIYHPVYDYLEECFNSITHQLKEEDQVICILNGNDENENELIKKHIPNKYDVILCKEANVSNARNIGIKNAKNRYLLFVDYDDIISYSLLKKCKDIIKDYNPDYISFLDTTALDKLGEGDLSIITLSKEEHLKIWEGNENELPLCYQFRSSCNHIYKKEIIEDNHILFNANQRIAEDTLFNFEYVLNTKKTIISNYISYYYRQNINGSTTSFNNKATDDIKILISNYLSLLNKYSINNKAFLRHLYKEMIFNYLPYIFRSNFFNRANSLTIIEKSKKIKTICNEYYFTEAIKNLKIDDCNTKKQKYFLLLLKLKVYFFISLLYKPQF